MSYYPTYVPNPLVPYNSFLRKEIDTRPVISFEGAATRLPAPFWKDHEDTIACYWKAWQLAFSNLLRPAPGSGFISNFIATAFNGCLFMWDSVFNVHFARYARRVYDFQTTLDNFYALQHPDGFICREISEAGGEDRFHRFDPASTGPNLLPWAEWEHYRLSQDLQRLEAVFFALAAFNAWFEEYRTWRDGTFWSSGWGCGMDNQPRLDDRKYHRAFSHAHMVWLDTCLQQVFVRGLLIRMAALLGKDAWLDGLEEKNTKLRLFIQDRLWDEATGFYYDLDENDCQVPVKSIGAYWSLLAGIPTRAQAERLVAHLENPAEFKRPHRIPTLSADHPAYAARGDYWCGSVWPPTNYMALRGLSAYGYDDLAHRIARNHLEMVIKVFNNTGTVWENYAPESAFPGIPARSDFVGWGGLPPIATFLEYVLGLRPDHESDHLVWDIRLTEEHGVHNYPWKKEGCLDLRCNARGSTQEKPVVTVSGSLPVEIEICWDGGKELVRCAKTL
jgi:hypothetical protein